MKPDFDCVVVGAGPAGLTAAYQLTKAGRRQLNIETAQWSRISLAIARALDAT